MPLGGNCSSTCGTKCPSGLERAREERGEAERALATLKRYAPEKGKLLQPRPDLKEGELFDQGRARQALDGAQEVNEAERRMAAIHSEQSKLLAQKAALAPWLELDLPLETQSTHQIMADRRMLRDRLRLLLHAAMDALKDV